MEEILMVVHGKDKVKFASSQAREAVERLAGRNVKVTLFAEGESAARGLLDEPEKITRIKAAGGEIIACVHDVQDASRLSGIGKVVSDCGAELSRHGSAERLTF